MTMPKLVDKGRGVGTLKQSDRARAAPGLSRIDSRFSAAQLFKFAGLA
jgi:hypothetical protein